MNQTVLSMDEMVQLTAAVITIGCASAATRCLRTKHTKLAIMFALAALASGAAALFFGEFQIKLF